MDSLFSDSKLKIKRANQHIKELDEVLIAFGKTNFHNLDIESDPQGGGYVLKFESTQPIPDQAPLIIGDTVHNLRSSLDLMACEIVRRAGHTPDKYTKFPFRNDRQELVNTINGGKIKAAGRTIIDLIVDIIKPYKGGNNALCALHDLDVMDKHKLLIPIVSVTALIGVDVADEAGNTLRNTTLTVAQGGKLNAVMFNTPAKITNYGQPTFGIFFDKGQAFEGQPVIPTLHELSQLVLGVVYTIEEAYLATGHQK